MSSANMVSIIYVPETDYGKTPDPTAAAITAQQARFTSESLSGTPTTTESAAIRTDRMSGGQVVTGLEVGGDLNFELARDVYFDDFMAAAMMDTWQGSLSPVAQPTLSLTPDPSNAQQATLTTDGDWADIDGAGNGIEPGDVLEISPPTGNPVVVTVISITDATNAVVAIQRDQPAIASAAMGIMRPEYIEIGTPVVPPSFSMGKAYKDVVHLQTPDEHSQTYAGDIVSGMSLSMAHGQIITGAFTTMGNGYKQESPSYEQQILAGGGTILPAGTSNPLNASVDVPIVTTEGEATEFCIESLNMTLDNGLTPQVCIGHAAPRKYDLGTAAISISASIFLGDASYDAWMPKKMSQVPISFTFVTRNADGGYAFAFSAIQLTFPDPAANGANQPVMIDASGTAKVGPGGASSLRIYRLD